MSALGPIMGLERTKANASLWRMLEARRVAVVGAAKDPTKYGAILLQSIIRGGFGGEIFPVNPNASQLAGLRCYPSVSAIPGSLDLAVVAVPAPAVPAVLVEAADKGAAGAFVISSGFKEVGRADLEKDLISIAHERGLRLFGPNIMGVAYAANRLSAALWPVITTPGPIGVVGQSGGVVAAVTDWAQEDGFGVSAHISLGNQADVCESDVLRLLLEDEHTRAVALYLEGVADGARFVSALEDVAVSKPIAVLKSGRSELGRRAVMSHSGSLAGSDRVFSGLCRQRGVVRVDDMESLYDVSKILAGMPRPAGNRVLVVSSSGGGCGLAADEASLRDLVLPPLPSELAAELRRQDLPAFGSFSNPLDLASVTLDHFRSAVRLVAAAGVADVILLIFADPIVGAADVASELVAESRAAVCVAFLGGGAVERHERFTMQRRGIPVFPTPERAIRAIAQSCWHADRQRRLEAGR
jgi:acyl-CoA synthetase (NDP forming)